MLTNVLFAFVKTGAWKLIPEEGHATLWCWSCCRGKLTIVQCYMGDYCFQYLVLLSIFSAICATLFPRHNHVLNRNSSWSKLALPD